MVCGRFGLWPVWFLAVLVVAVLVVAILVCGRFDLHAYDYPIDEQYQVHKFGFLSYIISRRV